MARAAHDDVLDALMAEIATCNRIAVCSAEPASHAEANTTYMLAVTALTPGTSVDFTIADGDADGRKVTVTAQSNVAISNSGTATHIALMDAANMMFATTCTTQVLTSGGTVTIPAFDIEASENPTAPA